MDKTKNWNEKKNRTALDYWSDPKWFEERNEQVVKDKENGMSIAELCGKYGVTPKRIYEIVKSYERKQNENNTQ